MKSRIVFEDEIPSGSRTGSEPKKEGVNTESPKPPPRGKLKRLYRELFTEAWLSSSVSVPLTLEDYARIFPRGELPYRPDFYPPKIGNHNGQRKLFNAFVGFLTRVRAELRIVPSVPGTRPDVCVYAGAAPNEYGALILKMFPDMKLIFIDPAPFKIEPTGGGGYAVKIKKMWPPPTGFFRPLFGASDSKTPAPNFPDAVESLSLMKKIDADSPPREGGIYLLNSFMTDDLAVAISKVFGRCIFVSDIRTNTTSEAHPDTLDIVWNLAQVYVWCRLANPLRSQFKWRHPFYDVSDEVFLKSTEPEMFRSVFEKAKSLGVDFVENALRHELVFFEGLQYLQTSPPQSSTELRLECGGDLKLKNYGRPETNDAQLFAWNSIYRTFQLYDVRLADPSLGLCCCGDCAILSDTLEIYFREEILPDSRREGEVVPRPDGRNPQNIYFGSTSVRQVSTDILSRLEKITKRGLTYGNHQGLYVRYSEEIIEHIFQVCAAAARQKRDPKNVFPWQTTGFRQ